MFKYIKIFLFKKIPAYLLFVLLIYITFLSIHKIVGANNNIKLKLASFLRYSSLKPEFLKFVDLNFNTLSSDYFWVLFVQETSSFKLNKMRYPYMYKILTTTVSLNKRFNYAYQAGGTMLGLVKKPHRAIKLLKMGMPNMAGNWNIPFLIAFNYFYSLGNYKMAAYYLKYAIKIKSSPKYLEFLYMKLLNNSNSLKKTKAFLEEMYKNNKNPYIRRIIKFRIDEVKKEMILSAEHKKFHIPYDFKLFLPKKRN